MAQPRRTALTSIPLCLQPVLVPPFFSNFRHIRSLLPSSMCCTVFADVQSMQWFMAKSMHSAWCSAAHLPVKGNTITLTTESVAHDDSLTLRKIYDSPTCCVALLRDKDCDVLSEPVSVAEWIIMGTPPAYTVTIRLHRRVGGSTYRFPACYSTATE